MLGTLLLGTVAAWSLWSCITLLRNYRVARRIGLPIVFGPFGPLNLPWILLVSLSNTIPAMSRFRDFVHTNRFLRFSYFGWQFDQGYAPHAEIGPMFTFVTPGRLVVFVGDADVAHNIFTNRKDFIKHEEIYGLQNVFGPHVNSAEGKMWQRHRRLTAPSFNERVSSSVWQESMHQARDMLQWWKSSSTGVSTTVLDTATATLHVLTACGFGVVSKFEEDPSFLKADDQLSYRDAILIVLNQLPVVSLIPEKFLSLWFMPRSIKTLARACKQFRDHVDNMLLKERNSTKGDSSNLLTNLIRASEAEKAANTSIGLTDEEILGNMFVFTMAGHETTAHATSTAIVYLARNPKYQMWLREELHHVLNGQKDIESAYSTSFPRLKRCLAIMLETLRLHSSLVNIPKATNDQPQIVTLKGSTHIIPPDTFVFINIYASQMNPNIWGDDVKEWKPDRWIIQQHHESNDLGSPLDLEEIYQPPPGAFTPWADGPRICPGKKFSQVEFVAIMSVLFLGHEIVPVLQGDKDETDAKLDEMITDSTMLPVTLQMRQPELVKFMWKDIAIESQGKE